MFVTSPLVRIANDNLDWSWLQFFKCQYPIEDILQIFAGVAYFDSAKKKQEGQFTCSCRAGSIPGTVSQMFLSLLCYVFNLIHRKSTSTKKAAQRQPWINILSRFRYQSIFVNLLNSSSFCNRILFAIDFAVSASNSSRSL
jgi:hypothetical protein